MNEPFLTYALAAVVLIGALLAFKIIKKMLVAVLIVGTLIVIGAILFFRFLF